MQSFFNLLKSEDEASLTWWCLHFFTPVLLLSLSLSVSLLLLLLLLLRWWWWWWWWWACLAPVGRTRSTTSDNQHYLSPLKHRYRQCILIYDKCVHISSICTCTVYIIYLYTDTHIHTIVVAHILRILWMKKTSRQATVDRRLLAMQMRGTDCQLDFVLRTVSQPRLLQLLWI